MAAWHLCARLQTAILVPTAANVRSPLLASASMLCASCETHKHSAWCPSCIAGTICSSRAFWRLVLILVRLWRCARVRWRAPEARQGSIVAGSNCKSAQTCTSETRIATRQQPQASSFYVQIRLSEWRLTRIAPAMICRRLQSRMSLCQAAAQRKVCCLLYSPMRERAERGAPT